MSDFNFRKPLSKDKKNLSEALDHINKVYNSNFSPVQPNEVDKVILEAAKTIGNLVFEPHKEGAYKVYLITTKSGVEIGHIRIGYKTKTAVIPSQLYLGKDRGTRELVLNMYPESATMRVTLSKSVGSKPAIMINPRKLLDAVADWITKNRKNMIEEVVDEAKEVLKVVKKDTPVKKKTGKTASEFNGDKRGFNRFVEEQDVEEIEEEEEIEEGVRMMSGAEKMVKDSGGSSLASSLRKIKKSLESKPTGSMIVVTKEKSPESVSVDIYEPSEFASLVKGLSSKPEAKVGSKGSWSGGEVTVVAIKEDVQEELDAEEAEDLQLQEFYRMQDWARFKRENPKGTPVFMVLNGRTTLSGTIIEIKPYDLGIARKGYFVYIKSDRGSLMVDDVDIMNIYFGDEAVRQKGFQSSVKSYKSKLGNPPSATKREEVELGEDKASDEYMAWLKAYETSKEKKVVDGIKTAGINYSKIGFPGQQDVVITYALTKFNGDVKKAINYIIKNEMEMDKERSPSNKHHPNLKAPKESLGTHMATSEKTEPMEEENLNEAYINTESIKIIRDELKKEFPKFKFMVAREANSYSSIRVAIVSGPVAFVYKNDGTPAEHAEINHYYPMNYKNGEILKKIIQVINRKNWDRSDISTDYFDVGFYLNIKQGNNTYGSKPTPFTLTGTSVKKPTPVQTQKKVNAIINKVVTNVHSKNAVTGKTHTKSTPANAGGPAASRYGVFEDKEEVNEKSPPTGPARKFSKDPDVKAAFKKKYGERWKEVMYATAWKMHNK